jgi:hypothetical protein
MKQQRSRNSNVELLRYAGLVFQVFTALGIAVFGGIQADKWLGFSKPFLVLALPLVVLSAIIIKIVRDTSKPRKKE